METFLFIFILCVMLIFIGLTVYYARETYTLREQNEVFKKLVFREENED